MTVDRYSLRSPLHTANIPIRPIDTGTNRYIVLTPTLQVTSNRSISLPTDIKTSYNHCETLQTEIDRSILGIDRYISIETSAISPSYTIFSPISLLESLVTELIDIYTDN